MISFRRPWNHEHIWIKNLNKTRFIQRTCALAYILLCTYKLTSFLFILLSRMSTKMFFGSSRTSIFLLLLKVECEYIGWRPILFTRTVEGVFNSRNAIFWTRNVWVNIYIEEAKNCSFTWASTMFQGTIHMIFSSRTIVTQMKGDGSMLHRYCAWKYFLRTHTCFFPFYPKNMSFFSYKKGYLVLDI